MAWFVKAALIAAGVVHLVPVMGVLGSTHLIRLYGITIDSPDLLILMRHRAVLFALLGLGLIASAFIPRLVWPGLVAGLIATVSFLVLAWLTGDYNSAIARVVAADVGLAVALVLAAGAQLLTRAAP